jgi:Fe-S cluster biogenesis protein NfuA
MMEEDAMSREAIEAVLDKFRPHFRGDGSDLLLGPIDPSGVVEVQIPIFPQTCVECLLPEDMIAKVLDKEIRSVLPELARVDVRLVKTY